MKIKASLFALVVLLSMPTYAQVWWSDIENGLQSLANEPPGKLVRVSKGRYLQVDENILETLMTQSAGQFSLKVPTPDGKMIDIYLSENSVLAPALQAKYPNIRSYVAANGQGQQIGRFSFSHKGLHGMFRYSNQWVYIDPAVVNKTDRYISYFRKDAQPHRDRKAFAPRLGAVVPKFKNNASEPVSTLAATGETLITYRMAISAAAEYTNFHGGTVADGLAALNNVVTRLNQVYLVDLAVQFQLVADNDQIIFTNANTDPYSNDNDDIDIVQGVIDGAIGNANYDIGHIVNTNSGLARLRALCFDDAKSEGATGLREPSGDAFYIDYVAHEVGHQFGAPHSFNGTEEGCSGDTREQGSAFEPGSASTIMGYAQLCGSQNLQDYSDPFFHIGSINQMRTHIDSVAGGSCGTESSLENNIPSVNAGSDYTIPARTPFKLEGSATDADGDTLTYSWEQYDPNGNPSTSSADMIDDGTRPLFRSWVPESSPIRYFPRFSDVLADTTVLGETYPLTTRAINFRLTVRDNKGGVNNDSMVVNSVANSSGFTILQPNPTNGWVENGSVLLRWKTGGSDVAPISCSSIDVEISNDAGSNFTDLLSGIGNDGIHAFILSQPIGNQYRLRLSCPGNIFYAVNRSNFSITSATSTAADSDGDGMSDEYENENNLDPNDAADAAADADQDGLSNLEESLLGTNPNASDSDGDGVSDKDELDAGTDPIDDDNAISQTTFTFESDSDLIGWDFTSDNPWARISSQAKTGKFSLASADIGDDEVSEVSFTGDFDAGEIQFQVKVSSETNWDYLIFLINGTEVSRWTGEQDWTLFTHNIDAGEQTLTWRYDKDETEFAGDDKAWIDDVVLTVESPNGNSGGGSEDKEYVAYDFDGDGKADPAVRRPSNSTNYVKNSGDSDIQRIEFGSRLGDIPVTGDFDGDDIADVAFRRPSNGTWYIKNSSGSNYNSGRGDGIQRIAFGSREDDIPVPADYDGDGITDVAVRRPSNGTWYIKNSSGSNFNSEREDGIQRIQFGSRADDIPVPADYDGDGKADVAVRRAGNYTWYIKNSGGSNFNSDREDGIQRIVFGRNAADIPVPADYDGDGKADIAVRRPSNGTWYIKNSSGNNYNSDREDGIQRIVFGSRAEDIPVVADYDGDTIADVAVRRPSTYIWYIKNSSGENFNSDREDGIQRIEFGRQNTDLPFAAPINTIMAMLEAAETKQ